MAKHLVYVLAPYSVPYGDLSYYMSAQLEPYRRQEDGGSGWFDGMCGRMHRDPFSDRETEYCMPPRLRRGWQGYICDVSRMHEAERAFAIVTLDGAWHCCAASYDEYRGQDPSMFKAADDLAYETWPSRYAEILRLNSLCWVLATWVRS